MKKVTVIFILIGLVTVGAYVYTRSSLSTHGFQPAPPKDSASATHPAESSLDLRPRLVAKLQQLVKDGSGGLYNLSVHEIDPDVLASEVNITNVVLSPDTAMINRMNVQHKTPDDVFKITAKKIQIKGLGIKDLLNKDDIDLKTIFVSAPFIEIFHHKRAWNPAKDPETVYQRLTKTLKRLSIDHVSITNGTLVSHDFEKNKPTKLNDISISLGDILVDSSTQYDRSRFLFAKKAQLSTKNFATTTSDHMYDLKVADITVNPTNSTAVAENISLLPKYSKAEFARKAGFMKERYSISIPTANIKNITWEKLLNENSLLASEADLSGLQVGIYLDRSLPQGKPRTNNFPSQLLMKIPMQVNIRKVNISNLDVVYEEFNPASGQTGRIDVTNLHGQVSNLTNMASALQHNHMINVDAKGTLLKTMPGELNISFDMSRYAAGAFTARLNIKNIEGETINPVAEPLGMFMIKRGSAKELDGFVSGTTSKSQGKVLLLYNDLHITPLEKNAKGLNKKNVTSLLANTLLIKNENPSGNKPPRNPECSFTRDPHASFLNFIWKTVFVGILKTIGAPERLAYQ